MSKNQYAYYQFTLLEEKYIDDFLRVCGAKKLSIAHSQWRDSLSLIRHIWAQTSNTIT